MRERCDIAARRQYTAVAVRSVDCRPVKDEGDQQQSDATRKRAAEFERTD